LDLKVSYPEELGDILKEIKKGKVKKADLNSQFKDKHVNHNLDILAKHGLLTRSYVTEGGVDYIHLEWSGKNVKFKQGQKNYPKRKGGMVF
jgi:hypothetical protein